MALNIRNREIEQLAAELAKRTGESKTEAVTRRSLVDELEQIAERCASLPVLDDRRAEEVLEYDEAGLPR